MSAQIIKNLEVAIDVLTSTPEEKVNLAHYAEITDCGTIACSLGTLAMLPYFQEQGLALVPYDDITFDCKINGGNVVLEGDRLFGERSFGRLFSSRMYGIWDSKIIKPHLNSMTDKQLAIARLQRQLAIYKDGATNE